MKSWKCFASAILGLAASATLAQSCPKVTYTTPNVTLKNLVVAVNCLNAHASSAGITETAKVAAATKSGLSVDSFQLVGPQHTHTYHHVVLAVLVVPVANNNKAVAVTPDNPASSITGTGGGQCRVKINPNGTVDGQCNLTSGTIYVIYRD